MLNYILHIQLSSVQLIDIAEIGTVVQAAQIFWSGIDVWLCKSVVLRVEVLVNFDVNFHWGHTPSTLYDYVDELGVVGSFNLFILVV
jgi:hypothetical protein